MPYRLIKIFFLICATSYCSVSNLLPVSFYDSLHVLKPLEELDSKITDIPNIDSLLIWESSLLDTNEVIPTFYGYPFIVNYSLSNTGTWDTLYNGDRIWRLNIICPNAYTVNFVFENFHLAENSHISFYNIDMDFILGPYNNSINKEHQIFSSHLITGQSIIVELFEPKNNIENTEFTITKIIYGYKDVFSFIYMYYPKIIKPELQSAECHRDANCPEGDDWCREKYSVAVGISPLQTDYEPWHSFSGSLINNTRNDFTPYFLTALHCLTYRKNTVPHTNEAILNQWSFKFGFIRDGCETGNELPSFECSGVDLISSWSAIDGLLVKFQTQLQSGDFFPALYFNGWDNSGVVPDNVTGLHHPDGDVMKISQKNTSPGFGPPLGFYKNYYWKVDWDLGAIEGGSSGSPLYTNNHKVIGLASSTTLYYPCNPDNATLYGRLDLYWLGGGTDETSLHKWLDPDDTGAETLDGIKMPLLCYGKEYYSGHSESINAFDQMKIGSSNTSPYVVNNAANITLTAGSEIIIRPCTKILSGSTFLARISNIDCNYTMTPSDRESDYNSSICELLPPPQPKTTAENFENFIEPINILILPNPFSEDTRISISLSSPDIITLTVYDVLGNRVAILAEGTELSAGSHNFTFSGHNINSGVYYVVMSSSTEHISRQLMLIK